MNHLRDLLDTCDGGAFRVANAGEFSQAECQRIADDVLHAGEQAVCFWLGDIEGTLDLKTIQELCKLPFDTCWFECEVSAPSAAGHALFAGLLCSQGPSGFNAAMFTKFKGLWAFEGSLHASRFEDVNMVMRPANPDTKDSLAMMIYAVKAFLSALHCSNVGRSEHKPEPKLTKARAKRGKAPLFSYWTLQLDGKSERGENQGGTHASPRVHLRRGHPRQHAPGKWTWVQPHAVGNKASGVVHKDYSAGPALLVPAR